MKSFHIRSKVVDSTAVIYPRGHLDAHNVERFEKEMLKLIGSNVFNIVVNCKELNYISSAGMGIIMGYLDEIREKGGDIKLCSLDEKVYEIFDLVGFTEIYDFLDDEDAAIEKYKNVS
ncbi:MAG: STAS domain-containing protein [bacterium]|nr:STAS domain-containing protein [bacterium]